MNASSPSPAPAAVAPRRRPHRTGWIVAAAVAFGLLLFLLIWNRDRRQPFFSAGPGTGTTANEGDVQVFEPLPAPLPAGADSDATRLPSAPGPVAEAERPRIIEAPRPAPARPAPMPTHTPPAPPASASAASSAPVPLSQPAPRYPREAMRAGAEGLVRVSVEVGPDGVPTSVSLASGSGHRELDRAALDAVRRWRFSPAHANGRPTVGNVIVPVQFTLSQ